MNDDTEGLAGTVVEKKEAKAKRDAKILELKAQGVRVKDIAAIVGKPESTIHAVLARFKPVFAQLDRIDDFNQVKSQLLSAAQLAALENAMSPNKLKKASFLASVKGAETLMKMERLERGLSTENINHKLFGRLEMQSPSSMIEHSEKTNDNE